MTHVKERLTFTTNKVKAFHDAAFIFIAVGTPSLLDGTADLTYIQSACADIGTYVTNDIIVVTKSTVPVGTNDAMRGWIEEKLRGDMNYISYRIQNFYGKVQVFTIFSG